MPRLLLPEWIKQIARIYLLQLYEKEPRFVHEWSDEKRPFAPVIEQMGKASMLIDAEELVARLAPRDLYASVSNLEKVRNYLQNLLGIIYLSELRESYSSLENKLAPYSLKLNELAYRWNLRSSWAGDELTWMDVQKVKENLFIAAGASALYKLSSLRIQILYEKEEGILPSDMCQIDIFSLYLAGGRRGFTDKLNKRLVDFEKRLKASGAKEPPSALRTHAEWWFDHYVYNKGYFDIANKIAELDKKGSGGPQEENIRKAIIRFSNIADIEPIESKIILP
jgi:hypothetical protein